MTFVVLGVDPGLSNPGLAVVERRSDGWHLLASPILHSFPELLDELNRWRGMVQCVSVEDTSWSGFRKRQGYGSGGIERVRGAAEMFAQSQRIPFVVVQPATWRLKIGGARGSTKAECRHLIRRMVSGCPHTLGLNRSDAIAIAITGAMSPAMQVAEMKRLAHV